MLIIDVSKTLFLSNHFKNVFLKKIICYALFCKNHQIIHCISKESRNNLILINFKFLDEEKECHIFFFFRLYDFWSFKQDPVNQMDFKDAMDFLRLLRHYAEKYDKIVVTSLAAAPSAFYSVCHNHLFLYSGHVRISNY